QARARQKRVTRSPNSEPRRRSREDGSVGGVDGQILRLRALSGKDLGRFGMAFRQPSASALAFPATMACPIGTKQAPAICRQWRRALISSGAPLGIDLRSTLE